MIQLESNQVTENLRNLFRPQTPASLRCFAVLAGDMVGKIWTDDLHNPTWGLVQELTFGTFHPDGQLPRGVLAQLVEDRRPFGEVLYGFLANDDELTSHFPPTMYDGLVWESDNRIGDITYLMNPIPDGFTMRMVDAELFTRIQDYQFYSEMFGSSEYALQKGFGYCLMQGDEIICEAFAGISHNGVIEIGVNTREAYARQGFATITCAYVIHEAEKRGYRTYWNCAAQNVASTALARKLGYDLKQYRLFGWW
jgi:RimJ/RimL family protein N-acetyltransferase